MTRTSLTWWIQRYAIPLRTPHHQPTPTFTAYFSPRCVCRVAYPFHHVIWVILTLRRKTGVPLFFCAVKRLRKLDVFGDYLLPISSEVHEADKQRVTHVRGCKLWIHPIFIDGCQVAGLVTETKLPPVDVLVASSHNQPDFHPRTRRTQFFSVCVHQRFWKSYKYDDFKTNTSPEQLCNGPFGILDLLLNTLPLPSLTYPPALTDGLWCNVQVLRHLASCQVVAHLRSIILGTQKSHAPCSSGIDAALNGFDGQGYAILVAMEQLFFAISLRGQPTPPQ